MKPSEKMAKNVNNSCKKFFLQFPDLCLPTEKFNEINILKRHYA